MTESLLETWMGKKMDSFSAIVKAELKGCGLADEMAV